MLHIKVISPPPVLFLYNLYGIVKQSMQNYASGNGSSSFVYSIVMTSKCLVQESSDFFVSLFPIGKIKRFFLQRTIF